MTSNGTGDLTASNGVEALAVSNGMGSLTNSGVLMDEAASQESLSGNTGHLEFHSDVTGTAIDALVFLTRCCCVSVFYLTAVDFETSSTVSFPMCQKVANDIFIRKFTNYLWII